MLVAGLLGAAACALAGGAGATTIVGPSNISADETWDAAGSPYYVTAGFAVEPNVTLTLEGPLDVLVVGNFSIAVDGTLAVNGSAGLVTFGIPLNATAPFWAGVSAGPGGRLLIDRALFNESPTALSCRACAEVRIGNTSFTRVAGTAASLIDPGEVALSDLRFDNVSTGIFIEGAQNASISNLSVVNANIGLSLQNVTRLTLTSARIRADETGLQAANVSNLVASGLDVFAPYGVVLFASSQVALHDPLVGGSSPISVWGVSSSVAIDRAVLYGPGDTGVNVANSDGVRVTNSRIAGMSWAGIDASGTGLLVQNTSIDGGAYGVYLSNTLSSWLEGLLLTSVGHGVYGVSTAWGTLLHSSIVQCRNSPVVLYQSNNWSVRENNFVRPGSPARSLLGDNNSWDDGLTGNFWFPNNFTDTDGDEVADRALNITGGAEADRFPRMAAWTITPFTVRLSLPSVWAEDTGTDVGFLSEDPLGEWTIDWSFECGGKVNGLVNFTANVTFAEPGACRLAAFVENLARQTVNATAVVLVRDITAPTVLLDFPAGAQTGWSVTLGTGNTTDNDPFFPIGATIAWNVTDPEGTVSTFYGTLGNYSFAPQIPGTYFVEAIVADAARNVGRVGASFVVLDVTAPSITAPAVITIDEDVHALLGPIEVRDDDPRFAEAPAVAWIIDTREGEARAYGPGPTVLIADPGVFDVNITACDASDNCVTFFALLIVVDTTPPHGFTPGPLVVTAGLPSPLNAVWLQDNQADWPKGASFLWTIDLAGGSLNLTGASPNITVTTPGVYYGTVRAVDAAGNAATFALSLLAYDGTPPALAVRVSADAQPGEPVNFSAAGSTDEASPVFAVWTFGDGTPDGAGIEISHTYSGEGEFRVQVEVRDLAGNANRTILHVRVKDTHNPTLRLLSPALSNGTLHCVVGETLELRAEAADTSPTLQIQWTFTSGGGADGSAADYACSNPGTVGVHLRARDGAGNENLTAFNITIEPAPGSGALFPALAVAGAGAAAAAALLLVRRRRPLEPK